MTTIEICTKRSTSTDLLLKTGKEGWYFYCENYNSELFKLLTMILLSFVKSHGSAFLWKISQLFVWLLSGVVVAWSSVWSEVQMICISSIWCQCHPIISCCSKIQNGLPFCCWLTQVVLEKRPLNGHCVVVVVVWLFSWKIFSVDI